jgi:signal transduction histidine kinase
LGETQLQPGAGDSRHDIDAVLAILSRPEDDELSDLVTLVATICEAEAAGITLQRSGEYHVPITYGIEPFVSPSTDTFCQHTMQTEGVFTVEDARTDPRFEDIGWVNGTIARTRFYASAPLYSPAGPMVGRLCVIDQKARGLTAFQQRSLETLAASVTKLIELRLLRSGRVPPATPQTSQSAATVITQLAAELSHDLRVPLASITASVELLQEELGERSTPVLEALVTRALRAADRMNRMLDQSLEFGTTLNEPTYADVDLTQLAAQVVSDAAALLHEAGATVEATDLPVVRADADDLYSVFQNLLTNSVKFARPGVPPRVHISARRLPDGWRISFCDNGVGIPEERRVDVFSLFSRGPSDVEGNGIGLATVLRIVTAHGGQAGAEPVEGGGTEIWFEMPDDEAAR